MKPHSYNGILILIAGLLIGGLVIGGLGMAFHNKPDAIAVSFDEGIQSYLMNNPDKLIAALENMQEHLKAKADEEAKAAAQALIPALYQDERDISIGEPDALVQIAEFVDYACGFCKRNHSIIMEVVQENPDVRVVFKEFPILSKASEEAARIALAIKDKSIALAYHNLLLTNPERLTIEQAVKLAIDANVSEQAIEASEDETIRAYLGETKSLAQHIGVQGTPAFIINGVLHSGFKTKQELQTIIDGAREALLSESRGADEG